jgi:hypothetical protein
MGNNNPVAGAAIFIDKKKTDAVTDQNGHYSVKVKTGSRADSCAVAFQRRLRTGY